MMPGIDPREDARKKRVRTAVIITAIAATASAALSGTRFSAWQWLPWILGLILIIVATTIAMAASGYRPGGGRGGRGGSVSGRGRHDDEPAGPATRRWRALVMASRLMPRPAGRRWLTEAESLLSEIDAARRGPAIRSYLLSAPRLALMMWTREIQRRARLGPRRPG